MMAKNGARPFLKIKIKEPIFTTFDLDLIGSPEGSPRKSDQDKKSPKAN